MKVYMWTDVPGGGGVVVVADSLERARELFLQDRPHDGCGFSYPKSAVLRQDPVPLTEEGVYHFPGCC